MKLPQTDSFYPTNIDTEQISRVISIINTGRAILFTGAGFSFGCENIFRESPPIAKELSKLIAKKGGIDEDDDLSYVSDYYLNYKNRNDLLHLLKEHFTIVSSKPYHSQISSMKWKRIYTTNYDNSIEKSATDSKKVIYSLTADDNPKEFYKKKNCCIHINGSISSVSEEDLDSKFKLTRTSYISPDSFVNSPWYYYFKKDLEQCSAIIFIGYSLYDIDIEKILFSSPILKRKTYFIIDKKPSRKEIYTLSKYGHVLPIGVDGFADKIDSANLYSQGQESNVFWLDAFERYQLSDTKNKISDDQILNFILHGVLEKEYIDNAISANQTKPFLIIRKCIEETERILKSNNFVAILSDFGNGKSIFLQEAISYLSILGKQVFVLQNPDGDYVKDIEKIDELGEALLIIDDYSLNLDILIHIAKFNSEKIKVIFSDRTNNHDRLRKALSDEDLQYIEISADILQQNEIEHFIAIIDNLGFWGEKANLSLRRKIEHISHIDRSQISHTLLNLFNSPQIKRRINSLLTPIINDVNYKDTIFTICLLEVLNLPRNSSLISEVSGNDFIYKSELRNNMYFNQLFQLKADKVISKSSLFSINLLNNHFTSSYITDKLLELAEKFDTLKDNGITERELFKSLLRFSFIERLLPEKNKLNSLVKYYEELKVRVGWLKYHPHFWLQYGMSRMNYGQLDKAQSNLDESYVLASNHQNYNTSYLDTQQARLFLLKALNENDGNIIWDFFTKAHNLLSLLEDDIYKFRQVINYKRFFEQKYKALSKKNKQNFVTAVNKMKNSLERSPYFHPDNIFSDYTMNSCHRYLSQIMDQTGP